MEGSGARGGNIKGRYSRGTGIRTMRKTAKGSNCCGSYRAKSATLNAPVRARGNVTQTDALSESSKRRITKIFLEGDRGERVPLVLEEGRGA